MALKTKWFHILLSLADRDLHGTAIMETVLNRTDRAIRLWPGALYGALGDMAEAGLIQEVGPPEGAITVKGRETLAAEVARMEELVLEARAKRVGKEPVGT